MSFKITPVVSTSATCKTPKKAMGYASLTHPTLAPIQINASAAGVDSIKDVSNEMLGASLVAAGAVASDGTSLALAPFLTGSAIGGTANAGVQILLNGQINPGDIAVAAITGGLSYGTSYIPTVTISVGGSILSSGLDGENPTGNAVVTLFASSLGYGFGYYLEKGFSSVFNDPLDAPFQPAKLVPYDGYLSLIQQTPKSALPSILGNSFGGISQEAIGQTYSSILKSKIDQALGGQN